MCVCVGGGQEREGGEREEDATLAGVDGCPSECDGRRKELDRGGWDSQRISIIV